MSDEIVGDGYISDILSAAGGLAQGGLEIAKGERAASEQAAKEKASKEQIEAAAAAIIAADERAVSAMAQAATSAVWASRKPSLAQRAEADRASAEVAIADADRIAASLPAGAVSLRAKAAQDRVRAEADAYQRATVADKGKKGDEWLSRKNRYEAATLVANKAANQAIRRDVPVAQAGGGVLELASRRYYGVPAWGWAAGALGALWFLRRK